MSTRFAHRALPSSALYVNASAFRVPADGIVDPARTQPSNSSTCPAWTLIEGDVVPPIVPFPGHCQTGNAGASGTDTADHRTVLHNPGRCRITGMLPGPILPSATAALMLPAPDQRDGSREECYPAGGGRDLVALHKPTENAGTSGEVVDATVGQGRRWGYG